MKGPLESSYNNFQSRYFTRSQCAGHLDTISIGLYTIYKQFRNLTTMICPTCKSAMIVVEYNQIELDYCTACRGVWFDSGELELLLRSMSLEDTHQLLGSIINSPEAASAEKKRRCPVCSQKMKKATIGKEPGILIDVCRREDGLWFDGGEVSHLVKQLGAAPVGKQDSDQRIISFLGDVFHAQD